MAVLTIRGLSETTLDALRGEADHQGRSVNRHLVSVLDEHAAVTRRAAQLGRQRRRLDALRMRVAPGQATTDSASLLWSERGGR